MQIEHGRLVGGAVAMVDWAMIGASSRSASLVAFDRDTDQDFTPGRVPPPGVATTSTISLTRRHRPACGVGRR